jgi:hypothetical protein
MMSSIKAAENAESKVTTDSLVWKNLGLGKSTFFRHYRGRLPFWLLSPQPPEKLRRTGLAPELFSGGWVSVSAAGIITPTILYAQRDIKLCDIIGDVIKTRPE